MLPAGELEKVEGLGDVDQAVAEADPVHGAGAQQPGLDDLALPALLEGAAQKLYRSLAEFRVRGVKTNIPFVQNVLTHPRFLAGSVDTEFIAATPKLFRFPRRQNRAQRLLSYLGNVIVNGPSTPWVSGVAPAKIELEAPPAPLGEPPKGWRQVFLDDGSTQVLVVASDLLGLRAPQVARVRELVTEATGVPAGHVFLACSHTHGGPLMYSDFAGFSAAHEAYLETLYHYIAGAAQQAANAAIPVRYGHARREVRLGANRRERQADGTTKIGVDLDAPVAPWTDVICFDRADGSGTLAIAGAVAALVGGGVSGPMRTASVPSRSGFNAASPATCTASNPPFLAASTRRFNTVRPRIFWPGSTGPSRSARASMWRRGADPGAPEAAEEYESAISELKNVLKISKKQKKLHLVEVRANPKKMAILGEKSMSSLKVS